MTFENVYYIKIGNKEQPEVEKYAIENDKVLIGYDKQVNIDDLIDMVSKSMKMGGDPENEDIIELWKDLKVKNSKAEANVQTALRRFFLARHDHDCFCTFFGNQLYYGIPAECNLITRDCEIGGLADKCIFRERAIDKWIPNPMDNPKLNKDLKSTTVYDSRFMFHHLSGMLQKMRAMRATLSRLDDSDKDYDDKYRQKAIFEYTVNDELERKLIDSLSDAVDNCDASNPATVDVLKESLEPLIRNLGPSEFEVFVDIVFYGRGYRRCSELGGIQEAVDMEYLTPDKKGVCFCQVKSVISSGELKKVMGDIAGTGMIPKDSVCYIAHHVKEVGDDSPAKKLADAIDTFKSDIDFKALPLSSLLQDAYKMEEVYIFIVGVYLGRKRAEEWYRQHSLSFLRELYAGTPSHNVSRTNSL